ncbi:MAG: glycosyltransferase family 4 protein [Candidatus Hodarchaeales archaeon]
MCKIKQKKIGIFIGSKLPPNVETVTFNLGKMISNDFNLDLISNCDLPDKFERYFFIQTFVSPSRSKYLNLAKDFINCYRYAKKERPDLLVTQARINSVITTIAGKVTRTPVINIKAGGSFGQVIAIEGNFNKIKIYILRLFTRVAFFLTDGIIVLGPFMNDQILSRGFKNKRIAMIPQPIDHDRFFPPSNLDKERFKKELGIEKRKKIVLFVGRLQKLKGAEILLHIIPQVLRQRSDIVFYLIGEGRYYNKFRGFDQNKVIVIGEVSHEKIDLYYKAADLFILPSLTEGLPNVILEALACGVPVVASGVGEIPWLVSNTLTSASEYIDYILYREWKKDTLPEEFSWDKLKEKYITFFIEIIEEYEQKQR